MKPSKEGLLVARRLGETLRALRKERRWSLEEVARRARGMDPAQLSRLERGEAPHTGVPTWTDVARVYGLTFGEFVRLAYPPQVDDHAEATP